MGSFVNDLDDLDDVDDSDDLDDLDDLDEIQMTQVVICPRCEPTSSTVILGIVSSYRPGSIRVD